MIKLWPRFQLPEFEKPDTSEILRHLFPKTTTWHIKRVTKAVYDATFWWVPLLTKKPDDRNSDTN